MRFSVNWDGYLARVNSELCRWKGMMGNLNRAKQAMIALRMRLWRRICRGTGDVNKKGRPSGWRDQGDETITRWAVSLMLNRLDTKRPNLLFMSLGLHTERRTCDPLRRVFLLWEVPLT